MFLREEERNTSESCERRGGRRSGAARGWRQHRFQPDLLLPDDISDADSSDSEYAQLDSSVNSGYEPDNESADEEEVEVVVLSNDEPNEVQMVAPAVDAKEGDKNLPIIVEVLPDVPDVPHVIVVKKEDQEEVLA